jgi:hypothetical protein
LNVERQKEKLGSFKKSTTRSAEIKMRNGFCLKSLLSTAETRYVLENYPDASIVEIGSVCQRGGKRYSIYDLIGYSVKGMVYLVVDLPFFKNVISSQLEKDFLTINHNPKPGMRAAFTTFIHENNLHWSRCCGRQLNRSFREKRSTTPSLLNN